MSNDRMPRIGIFIGDCCDDPECDCRCVDDHCNECGEFEAECVCYDESDEADMVLSQERDEVGRD